MMEWQAAGVHGRRDVKNAAPGTEFMNVGVLN